MRKELRHDIRSYLKFPEDYRRLEKLKRLKRLKYGSYIDFKTLKPAKRQEGKEHVD